MKQVSVRGLWTISNFEKHSFLQHTTETCEKNLTSTKRIRLILKFL